MCSLKVSRCLQPVSSSLSCGNLGSGKLSQPAEFRILALACFKPHSIPASWGGGGWKETTGKQSVLFPGDNTWELRLLICSGGFHGLSSLKTTSPLPVHTHVEELRARSLVLSLGSPVLVARNKLLWLLGWSLLP